jgi:hypothetical protein
VPFSARGQVKEVDDLRIVTSAETQDETRERVLNFYLRAGSEWQRVLESIAGGVSRKAKWLMSAQIVLAFSLLLLLVLFFFMLQPQPTAPHSVPLFWRL